MHYLMYVWSHMNFNVSLNSKTLHITTDMQLLYLTKVGARKGLQTSNIPVSVERCAQVVLKQSLFGTKVSSFYLLTWQQLDNNESLCLRVEENRTLLYDLFMQAQNETRIIY